MVRPALLCLSLAVALGCTIAASPQRVLAQSPEPSRPGAIGWRAPDGDAGGRYGDMAAQPLSETAPAQAPPITPTPLTGAVPTDQQTRAQVTKGPAVLPNDHGQVWREYDITPYTIRVESTEHPEQAIVDWILRETGYEAWHSTPVGLLSADRKTLRVYHTPQMQQVVAEIIDRFVSRQAQNHGFGLRIITMKNPNWRARALSLMTSIPVQSPGVQGWIMAREDAAILLSDLRKRTDFREHSTAHQMVLNGQSSVVSTMGPRSYAKGIILTQAAWPGYQPEMGQIDEGFTMEFSPLLSTDAATTDAVVKLKLAQVEKMLPVQLEVPSPVAANQKAQVEVPQLTMVQMHERFRWPTNQVLLLSIGVVATPGPEKDSLTDMLPLPKGAPRADALLMVESSGTAAVPLASPTGVGAVAPPQTASRPTRTFHGRY
ncbi:MAG: hypothetical protein H0T51_10340 [Pirellulales bacterium]|nr:hypothetical protein [Pirellulales bacterium]